MKQTKVFAVLLKSQMHKMPMQYEEVGGREARKAISRLWKLCFSSDAIQTCKTYYKIEVSQIMPQIIFATMRQRVEVKL